MSRSFLVFAGIAAVGAACSSSSGNGTTMGSGGSGATTTTTTKTTMGMGGGSSSSSSSSTGTGGTGGDGGMPCSDPSNPLLTSCLDTFLTGCWAPDMSGTCTDMSGVVTWSDGSKYVSQGAMAGLYAPGGSTPCIAMTVSGS